MGNLYEDHYDMLQRRRTEIASRLFREPHLKAQLDEIDKELAVYDFSRFINNTPITRIQAALIIAESYTKGTVYADTIEDATAALSELEALRAKATLLDRIEACIDSHHSNYNGISIGFDAGDHSFGRWINDDTEWESFPLMNVLRDTWKLYHKDELEAKEGGM